MYGGCYEGYTVLIVSFSLEFLLAGVDGDGDATYTILMSQGH